MLDLLSPLTCLSSFVKGFVLIHGYCNLVFHGGFENEKLSLENIEL